MENCSEFDILGVVTPTVVNLLSSSSNQPCMLMKINFKVTKCLLPLPYWRFFPPCASSTPNICRQPILYPPRLPRVLYQSLSCVPYLSRMEPGQPTQIPTLLLSGGTTQNTEPLHVLTLFPVTWTWPTWQGCCGFKTAKGKELPAHSSTPKMPVVSSSTFRQKEYVFCSQTWVWGWLHCSAAFSN